MSVKLLTEHHLRFLSLKSDCTGSLESTLVKMPHCWKSHVVAHISCKDGVSCTRMVAFLCFLLELFLMNKLHEQTLLGSITFIPGEIF